MQRIAVLNSGGDSPGMNAAVASTARSAALYGIRLVGIVRGYNGIIREDKDLIEDFFANARQVVAGDGAAEALLTSMERAVRREVDDIMPDINPLLDKYREKLALAGSIEEFLAKYPAFGEDYIDLGLERVLDISNLPGSYLRTARCEKFKIASIRLRAVMNLVAAGIEGLVVIGGDGSFKGATLLCQIGMPCVGIPGTIDNDLAFTEMTLGFDTAVNVCMKAVLQVRSTSRAHDRPHVVEVMGNARGDIALRTAMATGAEIVIVREVKWSVEFVAKRVQEMIDRGNYRATVVISEGAYKTMEPFDVYTFSVTHDNWSPKVPVWPGQQVNAHILAELINCMCTGRDGGRPEARATVLGYTQRGEAPSAYDTVLGFNAGNMAVRLLMDNREDMVVGVQKGSIYSLSINDAFKMQEERDKFFNRQAYNLINQL